MPDFDLKLPLLFSDHMIIQAGKPVRVWGSAAPGESVTATLMNLHESVAADESGEWSLTFPAPEYGGPFSLAVSTRTAEIVVNDMMTGEVWLASGQSNMEMPMGGWGQVEDFAREIDSANYPQIRFLKVDWCSAARPKNEISGSGWQVCSPAAVAEMTAAGYYFARRIHEKRDVPVGIIQSTMSGTIIEAWMSGAAVSEFPALSLSYDAITALTDHELTAQEAVFLQNLEEWNDNVYQQDRGVRQKWFLPKDSTQIKAAINLPDYWQSPQPPELRGAIWYARRFELLDINDISSASLSIGLRHIHQVWLNGHELSPEESAAPFQSQFDGQLLREGENVLVLRVVDLIGNGGLNCWRLPLTLELTDDRVVQLSGRWHYRTGVAAEDFPEVPASPLTPNQPCLLFNGMIAPLTRYAIRGFIWYQGESNVTNAGSYEANLAALIRSWRIAWGDAELPFIYSQLTSFLPDDPEQKNRWPLLREAQTRVATQLNTAMCVTYDLGDKLDIHPKNKREVGERLALIALSLAYGEEVEESPVYILHEIDNDVVTVEFSGTSELGTLDSSQVRGFELAGRDKVFHAAAATIVGVSVVLKAEAVPDPVNVRYAWSDFTDANLCGVGGLPVVPFRTDDW